MKPPKFVIESLTKTPQQIKNGNKGQKTFCRKSHIFELKDGKVQVVK